PKSPHFLELDPFIDEVFSELKSDFLELPKGQGFVEYRVFETGFQTLKRATAGFTIFDTAKIIAAIYDTPIAFIVLRTILGFTPSEWAEVTTENTGVSVDQGIARAIDRSLRTAPLTPLKDKGLLRAARIKAMVEAAIITLQNGVGAVDRSIVLHRLDKVDTAEGLKSLRPIADLGVPYPVLLYERFLGRPFASHRDSVSESVGDVIESAIEDVLVKSGVSYRKTKRAERIAGFDQAPDFIIPDEFNPAVVIEAKVTEDDGTARDKVSRVQRLRTLRDENGLTYDVIACIAGRGFKVRRNDMRRLLVATNGLVFTLETIECLISETRLRNFATR
ncbi:hypothetical protein JDN40_01125, partial [Rhodomicrobium vannielii ATCC 17100]|uniref:hypothetical protein n=1 Tax=Rhodomicrobium vannielii TaxID=1069 RepID=UPI00191B1953